MAGARKQTWTYDAHFKLPIAWLASSGAVKNAGFTTHFVEQMNGKILDVMPDWLKSVYI